MIHVKHARTHRQRWTWTPTTRRQRRLVFQYKQQSGCVASSAAACATFWGVRRRRQCSVPVTPCDLGARDIRLRSCRTWGGVLFGMPPVPCLCRRRRRRFPLSGFFFLSSQLVVQIELASCGGGGRTSGRQRLVFLSSVEEHKQVHDAAKTYPPSLQACYQYHSVTEQRTGCLYTRADRGRSTVGVE